MKLKLPKVEEQSTETTSTILEMNANIKAILGEIIKMQSEVITDKNEKEIKEIIGKADLIITECHSTRKFQIQKNAKFNRLVYEYQRLNLKYESYQISKKIKKTMNRAAMLEKESANRAKQLEDIKNEQKSIITTIISIVLAISIIPTAIAGIEHIDGNYILPFLAIIITFGLVMIGYTYSLYQEKFKKRIIIFLVFFGIITGGLWYLAFNFDISVTQKIEQNVVINNDVE